MILINEESILGETHQDKVEHLGKMSFMLKLLKFTFILFPPKHPKTGKIVSTSKFEQYIFMGGSISIKYFFFLTNTYDCCITD